MQAFALGLRRGRQQFAQAQLEQAEAHPAPGFELSLAAAHLALREPRAALRLNAEHAERYGDSSSLEESAQRSLQRAYAENELGDKLAAFLAARSANQLCEAAGLARQQALSTAGAASSAAVTCRDAEWAFTASTIAARQRKQLSAPIDLNKFITGDIQVENDSLALWSTLAVTPEVARRPLRVRLRRPTLSVRWMAFGFQLAAEVASGSGDVDVWLDAAAGRHRPGDLLSYFVARASVARWRGDATAERVWAARSKRAEALAADDTASYLLSQAGY